MTVIFLRLQIFLGDQEVNLEEQTAVFSTASGFVPKAPVFEKASGSSYPSFLTEKRVNVLLAIFIIAGIFVCVVRRVKKSNGNTSVELVAQNIGRGQAQYAVVNENEQDSIQEGQDATIEEVV